MILGEHPRPVKTGLRDNAAFLAARNTGRPLPINVPKKAASKAHDKVARRKREGPLVEQMPVASGTKTLRDRLRERNRASWRDARMEGVG